MPYKPRQTKCSLPLSSWQSLPNMASNLLLKVCHPSLPSGLLITVYILSSFVARGTDDGSPVLSVTILVIRDFMCCGSAMVRCLGKGFFCTCRVAYRKLRHVQDELERVASVDPRCDRD